MRSYKNRPIIEAGDSPQTVNHALRASIRYWNSAMPHSRAFAWQKQATDAYESLEDGFHIVGDHMFKPDGEALLYMTPDDLELSLVAYGCDLLDQRAPNADSEVVAINGLLKQIDHIKAA